MPLITDYGTLQTAIADWLWRVDDTNIDANKTLFIDQFERAFKRKVRCLEMHKSVTATLGSSQLPIPTDFLEMIRFQFPGLTPVSAPLRYVTPDTAAEFDASPGISGPVAHYTILNGNIVVTPQSRAPTGSQYELIYYSFTQLANATGGVNWLLTKHPDLYLFGALMRASAYIDDKETVAYWKAERDEALFDLLEMDKKAKVGGPLQMRPSARFVSGSRGSGPNVLTSDVGNFLTAG